MISATAFEALLELAVAAFGGVVGLVVLFKNPFWGVAATLAALPLVPYWIGTSVSGFFVTAPMALAAVTTVAVLRARQGPIPLSLADWAIGALLVGSAAAFLTGHTTIAQVYTLFQWVLFYAFGRVASATYGLPRMARWLVAPSLVVAAALLVEFATGTNLWVQYVRANNALYQVWSTLQSRGGVLRAEGSFGHSIAAGASLAMVAVLVFLTRWSTRTRLAAVALLAAAVIATVSRLGMVSLGLGVLLTVLLARGTGLGRVVRIWALAAIAVAATAVIVGLSDIFAESGSEAADSASYRGWLTELIPTVQPLGMAESFNRSTAGGTSFGAFRSIDSALLLFALTQGWVASLVVLGLVIALALRVARLEAGPASLAVLAQLPALVGVALITQYGHLFWVVVGLAVTEAIPRPSPPPLPTAGPVRLLRPASEGI